jgi:hypothetical protein
LDQGQTQGDFDMLKGLTVAQAKFVLDIVIEDFTANAVVVSDQFTSSF